MNKLISAILCAATALALLTGSIAVPILVRPFYYAHIEPMELEEVSGLSREEIICAYDEVLDFCIGRSDTFSAGVLPFSESGASHFADCRTLFILDLVLLAVSAAAIAAIAIYARKHELPRLRGHGAPFWGAAGIGGLLALIGAAAATDFDRAFTVFHSIFFPGKDDWIFSASTDPIILLMPETFFRNCAVCILAVLLIAGAAVIVFDNIRKTDRIR